MLFAFGFGFSVVVMMCVINSWTQLVFSWIDVCLRPSVWVVSAHLPVLQETIL